MICSTCHRDVDVNGPFTMVAVTSYTYDARSIPAEAYVHLGPSAAFCRPEDLRIAPGAAAVGSEHYSFCSPGCYSLRMVCRAHAN